MNTSEISDIFIDAIKLIKQNILSKVDVTNIETKSYQDYVTNLDLEIEDFLITFFENKIGDSKIFSEEKIKERIDISDINCVIIDPLDGTLNKISNLGFYCISISYLEKGMPKVGVIYDITSDRIFSAIEGKGFFINGKKAVQDTNSKLCSISNEFLLKSIEIRDRNIIGELRKIGKIRILGSQALHLAYTASGILLSNINYEAKIWDDVAGFVMVKESGKKYTSFNGQEIFPKKFLDPKENLKSVATSKDTLGDIVELVKVLN